MQQARTENGIWAPLLFVFTLLSLFGYAIFGLVQIASALFGGPALPWVVFFAGPPVVVIIQSFLMGVFWKAAGGKIYNERF